MYSFLYALGALVCVVTAQCPHMNGDFEEGLGKRDNSASLQQRESGVSGRQVIDNLSGFEIDDSNSYLTSDVGGPIEDQNSLKAGIRGPTLLEDFIFRQKIMHFDHERVPERAVHARGAGAHGIFTSYGNYSNITAASFLAAEGKTTPVFLRFSTVAGSRGSADTVRDVRGFAARFYTDEGNFDVVGNNIPVFFIQDAIKFPDLIHAVKPEPDREIPQAATAHDTAWDFFSQQPSTLHTLFWAMSQVGTIRTFRHMDGFGVHTFRFVTADGSSKLVKFHFKTLQGKASTTWEEAQRLSGNNPDAHRADLWNAIENGHFPEWEFGVQIMDEKDQLRFGFDLLDPTKFVPEELAPFFPLGKLTLNRNPTNYFAETEQIMFQVGHLVRGIDFTDDPLLQGRVFSYLDTQLNRNGGPNFEQLPINQPKVPWHNNNRDGAGQMYIHKNKYAYSPKTFNNQAPLQANQTSGNGFFTAPARSGAGSLLRAVSPTFDDVWSQPRLFYNSLTAAEQQNLINAMRFEIAQLQSTEVKINVLTQLNRVSHDVALRVAAAVGMEADVPAPDETYYHNNSTQGLSVYNSTLLKLEGLKVGILTSNTGPRAFPELTAILAKSGVSVAIVAELLEPLVNQTYSTTGAEQFDAIIISNGTQALFSADTSSSSLYPADRPRNIIADAYRWGKPIAAVGLAEEAFLAAGVKRGPGIFTSDSADATLAETIKTALFTYTFWDRFVMDK